MPSFWLSCFLASGRLSSRLPPTSTDGAGMKNEFIVAPGRKFKFIESSQNTMSFDPASWRHRQVRHDRQPILAGRHGRVTPGNGDLGRQAESLEESQTKLLHLCFLFLAARCIRVHVSVVDPSQLQDTAGVGVLVARNTLPAGRGLADTAAGCSVARCGWTRMGLKSGEKGTSKKRP